MNRSPAPIGAFASTSRHTTSTSRRASRPTGCCTARRAGCAACGSPECRAGRSATSGVVRTPRICVRVVCGRFETMDTFEPTSRFTSVDFPTLGRPTRLTNPERCSLTEARARRARAHPDGRSRPRGPRRRARGTGMIATEAMRRPSTCSVRNSRPWNRTVSPASGTWPSRLKTRPPTVSHSVSGSSTPSTSFTSSIGVRPGAADPPAASRSTPGLLGVVLVDDLADDLLEQVLERDEAGGARRTRRRRSPCGTSASASRGAARRPASDSGTNTASRTATRTGSAPAPARDRWTRSFRYTMPMMLSVSSS